MAARLILPLAAFAQGGAVEVYSLCSRLRVTTLPVAVRHAAAQAGGVRGQHQDAAEPTDKEVMVPTPIQPELQPG